MADQPFFKSFLKGLLGGDKPVPPPSPPPEDLGRTPPTRSEAYHQRKKGRKLHEHSIGDLERIAAILLQKPEVTPGEMAQQLGMSRSTLAYNLNRLREASHKPGRMERKGRINYRVLQPELVRDRLFAGKRLEKLGAGKYVRYRLVEGPPKVPPQTP